LNETLFSQSSAFSTDLRAGWDQPRGLPDDQRRCRQLTKLAGASARELSELARTFLRTADDQLYVGIYYSRWLIAQLEEHDPRAGLTNRNIRSLIMFVEEINHALHAAIQFCEGERRIPRRILRAISSSRRGSIPISYSCYSSLSFARRSASREPIAAGCASIFSRRKIRAGFRTLTCAPVIGNNRTGASYTRFLDTLNGLRGSKRFASSAPRLRRQEAAHPRLMDTPPTAPTE
jgi:hypothetical protein